LLPTGKFELLHWPQNGAIVVLVGFDGNQINRADRIGQHSGGKINLLKEGVESSWNFFIVFFAGT
jgi:hypothetical protein